MLRAQKLLRNCCTPGAWDGPGVLCYYVTQTLLFYGVHVQLLLFLTVANIAGKCLRRRKNVPRAYIAARSRARKTGGQNWAVRNKVPKKLGNGCSGEHKANGVECCTTTHQSLDQVAITLSNVTCFDATVCARHDPRTVPPIAGQARGRHATKKGRARKAPLKTIGN